VEFAVALIAVVPVALLLTLTPWARGRFAPDRTGALVLAAPIPLALLPAAYLLAAGPWFAALPLASIAAMCAVAASWFAPTRAARFRSFERQFRAHVHDGGLRSAKP
jgi:hypothetical protein